MTQDDTDPSGDLLSRDAIRVLEIMATAAGVTLDRILATRALGEVERAIPGDDWQTWSQHLVEVGESLNLRVRRIEFSLDEAVTFVEQDIPVATCRQRADGGLEWIVITNSRRNQLRITSLDETEKDAWVSKSKVRSRLGLTDAASTRPWVIGQAALGCDPQGAESGTTQHGEHLSPFRRLVGLLKPERQDLWVILVFSAFVGLLALATPIAVEALVNTVAFGRFLQPVLILAILLFTFLAIAAAMRALITYIVEILQRRMFVRVVEDLAYRFPRVRQRALDNEFGPELANRFFDIVTVQKSFAALLLDGIGIVLQTVIGMVVLAFYHPFLLGFDIALLLLIAFIIFGLGRGAVTTSVKESKSKYAVAAWLEELIRHPTAFKLHGGTQFALDRADQLVTYWLEARRSHFRVLMRQILFALGLQALAATVLLGLGGWLVIMGELTLGQLVAAELIVMIIVGSFAKLGKYLDSFYDLLASVDKLGHLFDLPTESHDKLFHLPNGMPAAIKLQDVSYRYGSHSVLKSFSLDIAAGTSVAIVGQSASGKSTLVDILCGIRQPSSGHVELDGVDIRELRPDALREHLSAARSVEIFHGSIDENVHLNRPHISALDVRSALESVGLHDELLRLPEGLNTRVQTDGAPLSSSQAARLMLARAIVGKPRLLLIDGTLDGLCDEALTIALASLVRPGTPWTLIVATGRHAVQNACSQVATLG